MCHAAPARSWLGATDQFFDRNDQAGCRPLEHVLVSTGSGAVSADFRGRLHVVLVRCSGAGGVAFIAGSRSARVRYYRDRQSTNWPALSSTPLSPGASVRRHRVWICVVNSRDWRHGAISQPGATRLRIGSANDAAGRLRSVSATRRPPGNDIAS